jgi:CBS domain-containing protein
MNKHKVRELPVRVRQTVHGDGESSAARTVLCPRHGCAVAVAECGECEACKSIATGPNGDLVVTCEPEPVHPTMRWAPLLRRILPSAADRVAIADVMTRDVVCVTRDVTMESLTTLLLDRRISAAPVVDDAGYPIGVVSKTDLVRERWENVDSVTSDGEDKELLEDGLHVAHVLPTLVADLMMPLAFTLREDEPLSRAAAVMDVEGVHHLPVVSADGKLVGMLSSLDFVRWIARQSAFADQV